MPAQSTGTELVDRACPELVDREASPRGKGSIPLGEGLALSACPEHRH
ncbi:MAG: hypothetical protein PWQ55_1861 [Chloroflexota bacterium]|nr:hypothetical protein [Chloroflexota bacterium]